MIYHPHHPPQYIDQCEAVYSPYTDPVAMHFRETLYKIQEEIREGMDWDRRNPRWLPPWNPNWIVPRPKPAEFTQHQTQETGECDTRSEHTKGSAG